MSRGTVAAEYHEGLAAEPGHAPGPFGPGKEPGRGGGSGNRQDPRAVLGDGHRVLGVSGPAAVAAVDRPAVAGDPVDVPAAGQEPRLDGDDQPGDEPAAAPGRSLVGDVRIFVHGPSDAVAGEVGADPVTRRAAGGADGRGYVPDPCAGNRRGDACLEGVLGDGDQAGVG